jgi:hypothetical protein
VRMRERNTEQRLGGEADADDVSIIQSSAPLLVLGPDKVPRFVCVCN